jgi:hypothetical protein
VRESLCQREGETDTKLQTDIVGTDIDT